MPDGDQFTFNATVTHSVIGGSNHVQHNAAPSETPSVRELADRLAALVQSDSPALGPTATAVQSELARAEQEGQPAATGKLRDWLDLIIRGVSAGSSAATAAEGLLKALGLG